MTKGPHRLSRAREREQLEAHARAQQLPASCDVCVIGGGASGLACAITAAEAGASVVVLERDDLCGRRILATGNGRCNFANVSLEPRRYNHPSFVACACGSTWLDDILSFFRTCGMRWCLEDDRLYPVSRQAASVRNVLLARARHAAVCCAVSRNVTHISASGDGTCWHIRYRGTWDGAPSCTINSHAVVLAVGGDAIDRLTIPRGLKRITERPVLAPLACEPSPLQELNGRRVQVSAELYQSAFPQVRERGEVLFRDYGLSGIVSFDLSRTARPGDVVSLDLVPDYHRAEICHIVDPHLRGTCEDDAFDGLLDPSIAAVLMRLARQRWHLPHDMRATAPEPNVPTTETQAMISLVKGLPFRITGIAHPEQAQVTRGGLDVDHIEPTTLSIHDYPGLFACGEALDIDADCGGFNLAWAWKSGMIAGSASALIARGAHA